MAGRPLEPVGANLPADPIAIIAEADRLRQTAAAPPPAAVEPVPDLQPPSHPLAPQGFAGVLDEALGGLDLPSLIELADALDIAARTIARAEAIDPGVGELVSAVIADEQRKVMRYLDIRDT